MTIISLIIKKLNLRVIVQVMLIIISFLYVAWAVIILQNEDGFNQEEDVCLKTDVIECFRFIDGNPVKIDCLEEGFADCIEWRPKDECEKGNPDYIETFVCVSPFQMKVINATIERVEYQITLKTKNKDMYACEGYRRKCEKNVN